MAQRRREDGLPVTERGTPAYRVIVQEWAEQRREIARLRENVAWRSLENEGLREQVQRLTDQHGTFPYLGDKSELQGL